MGFIALAPSVSFSCIDMVAINNASISCNRFEACTKAISRWSIETPMLNVSWLAVFSLGHVDGMLCLLCESIGMWLDRSVLGGSHFAGC